VECVETIGSFFLHTINTNKPEHTPYYRIGFVAAPAGGFVLEFPTSSLICSPLFSSRSGPPFTRHLRTRRSFARRWRPHLSDWSIFGWCVWLALSYWLRASWHSLAGANN